MTIPDDISAESASEFFTEGRHVCMIFDDEMQCRRIISQYFVSGLRRGEAVRYAADATPLDEIRAWLLELDDDIPEGASFSVFSAEEFYCSSGCFDPQEMISAMLPRFEQLREAGYTGIRSCGEMTWALKGIPGSDSLLEYEARLNTVAGTFPHTGICLYDARLFDGATLFKILAVHPYMIAQGQIVQNPFYVRPEEFFAQSGISF